MEPFQIAEAEVRQHCVEDVEGKIYQKLNNDIWEIKHFGACHTKGFKHDENGRVDEKQYKKLVDGIAEGKPEYIDNIKLGGTMKLVSPRNNFDCGLLAKYKGSHKVPFCPKFSSDESGAELVELFAMAKARDIPFNDYENSKTIRRLSKHLSELKDFTGPTKYHRVTPSIIFRGNSNGDLVGPFLSQFLLLPIKYGPSTIEQKYFCYAAGKDYITDLDIYTALSNGEVLEKKVPDNTTPTYIHTLRDGCSWVHTDEPFQGGLNAALYLLRSGFPLSKGNPYSNGTIKNQVNFVSLGRNDLFDLITCINKLALDGIWWVKYHNLRLRPEEMAYQLQLENKHLSNQIKENKIVKKSFEKYGNYLLSQAFPEGSPCHPSYGSGHAVAIGACVTILKAWFDESTEMNCFHSSSDGSKLEELDLKLKLGDELNKLASNISTFRNAAGIHYRSDMIQAIKLGEQIAISLLKERIRCYNLKVEFKFHLYDGEKVKIKN